MLWFVYLLKKFTAVDRITDTISKNLFPKKSNDSSAGETLNIMPSVDRTGDGGDLEEHPAAIAYFSFFLGLMLEVCPHLEELTLISKYTGCHMYS